MIGHNETAFPVVHPDGAGVQYFGIGLRAYVATKAMQGLLANPEPGFPHEDGRSPATMEENYRNCARLSVGYADALLAELAKVQPATDADDATARDARRYRWLRDHRGSNRLPHVTQYPPQDFDGDRYFVCQIAKHGLDAAVDAAMQMAQPA